ncbi:MAG: ABC transporter ATP-binding protein [Spirochaetes bacterium]|nr:ABC transporter ATP-binding protein [Spirochaetota bacterium]
MEKSVIVKAKGLEKIYGIGRSALRVLKGISFEIGKGEAISIVGPSGAGKSTLLNLIGCLDAFQAGSLAVMGREIANLSVEDLSGFRNRHVGFVFQFHNLLPEFTALENAMIPLMIRRVKRKEARQRALHLLERFNLAERAHHKPSELSGGECQRVAVARAIIGNPDLLLADEPTGNLDSANSLMLTDMLLSLGRDEGTTVVIVTHDRDIATRTGKTITLIDGKIEE